ncbi:hypothetical protein [Fibrella forsythiae]|uniref:Lipoprotein n=1 Tax=Fibrella forsythiae TaxID=2817061 RepID=A0ABS3JEB3_9BACT|nr:hypothetical protein [Fibrella forsythiae]MBO0947791.1 hypothetical protein [Fibrella forsythiae]
MKTAKLSIRFLAYGLCLAATLYNCKTKDVDSLTPFTYTFKGFDTKLPDITPTAPAAVSVTASTFTSSTAAAAVSSGLSSMSATGVVPASVQQASNAVASAVSPAKAAELAASFSPAVMANLTATGTLPANLKAEASALAANPALKAYLPTFTLPTVNGKPVGGRTSSGGETGLIEKLAATNARADDDACKAAAAAAYNTALTTLNEGKATQDAAVNATFAAAQAAIASQATSCVGTVTTNFAPLRAAAAKDYNDGIAGLNANKAVLGSYYDLLVVLYAVAYVDALGIYNTLQAAENAACSATATARTASATAARNTDLNKITANYNTAKTTLDRNLATAVASCHNQGNGG